MLSLLNKSLPCHVLQIHAKCLPKRSECLSNVEYIYRNMQAVT